MSSGTDDGPEVAIITMDHIYAGLLAYITPRAEDVLRSKGESLDDVVREHLHFCRVKGYPDMLGGYAIAGPKVLCAYSTLDQPHILIVYERGEIGQYWGSDWGFSDEPPYYGERHPAQVMHTDYFVTRS